MRLRGLYAAAVAVMHAGLAAATTSGRDLVNVSGPALLRGIGPTDPRVDAPMAAGVTALVVAFVIYRGLRVHENKKVIIGLEDAREAARNVVRSVQRRFLPGDGPRRKGSDG